MTVAPLTVLLCFAALTDTAYALNSTAVMQPNSLTSHIKHIITVVLAASVVQL
jgi:hypothetical protein